MGTQPASRILVYDSEAIDRSDAEAALSTFFPLVEIDNAASRDIYEQKLKSDQFDIVVLDGDIGSHRELIEMLFRLKTQDYEPSVIVVAKNPNTNLLNSLYSYGCHRCIEKDERWLEELGTAVDSLMRIRKITKENIELRAKLTEANMLLQERNRRLDEFSATLAHDIRGPLGSVLMRLEYILDTSKDDLSERNLLLIERAKGSVDRLVDLVQTTYEYAKLGEKATAMVELNLEEMIYQVFEDLNLDESLDVQVTIDDLPVLWGNRGLLTRVFLNLISNAVKYNDKDKIRLHIGVQETQDTPLGEYVTLFLRDNGPGIPEDEQEQLFTIFKRGSLRERDTEGSGVGLAVVKRIIELHHGFVYLESSPEEGTTFYLKLPLKPLEI